MHLSPLRNAGQILVHSTPRGENPGAGAAGSSKRAQTKLENRRAILTAAREVFAEVGYEAASVRDIIGRTGLETT